MKVERSERPSHQVAYVSTVGSSESWCQGVVKSLAYRQFIVITVSQTSLKAVPVHERSRAGAERQSEARVDAVRNDQVSQPARPDCHRQPSSTICRYAFLNNDLNDTASTARKVSVRTASSLPGKHFPFASILCSRDFTITNICPFQHETHARVAIRVYGVPSCEGTVTGRGERSTRSAVGLEIRSVAAHLRNCGALFGDAGDVLALWRRAGTSSQGGC